jgi:hypothetical protein
MFRHIFFHPKSALRILFWKLWRFSRIAARWQLQHAHSIRKTKNPTLKQNSRNVCCRLLGPASTNATESPRERTRSARPIFPTANRAAKARQQRRALFFRFRCQLATQSRAKH